MQPALSLACSLAAPFPDDVADYAAGHCTAVELWLTKIESYLDHRDAPRSADAVRRAFDEHGVAAPVASVQGGLLASQGDARRLAWELFERRLALCRALGVGTLVVACDVPRSAERTLDRTTFERVLASLRQAATAAGEAGVRLALEFQASSALGNNLQTAAALVADVGSRHLGLCFDAFHYYTGPSKPEDLGCLTGENLFHVQLCDLADRPRELATDSDRILPGEGDIDLAPLLDRLRTIGYDGCVAIELLNPQLWQVPPRQFGEIAITALRRLLGLASHG